MEEIHRPMFVFLPALAPLLLRAEELKGSPLTEDIETPAFIRKLPEFPSSHLIGR